MSNSEGYIEVTITLETTSAEIRLGDIITMNYIPVDRRNLWQRYAPKFLGGLPPPKATNQEFVVVLGHRH